MLFLAAALLPAAAQAPALAAVESFKIDPGHSMVGFKVRHFVSKVPGRFLKYSGTIDVDPADMTTAKISVDIDTTSLDTDVEDRDKHLKGPDFFDVEKFPKITFASKQVVTKGPGKVALLGDLTLRGETRPVEIEVDVLGFAPDGRGGTRSGFEAHTTIDRKAFGMSWNRALDTGGFILGDEVEIMLNIEAIAKKPEAEKPAAK
jgi:polyisoprenoid-binding protein YceI